jgi:RHH-type rel operon transcriptional repressor/antitoxin RelB
MANISIDADIDAIVQRFAKNTGRSRETVLREVILRGLENLEDEEDVRRSDEILDRLERGEIRTYTSAEVKRRLGLDD